MHGSMCRICQENAPTLKIQDGVLSQVPQVSRSVFLVEVPFLVQRMESNLKKYSHVSYQ